MSLGPVMIGLSGTELLAEEREMLRHPLAGGVILFSRNYESPEQVTALTGAIHALRDPPLLVAVDHEGGRVQRFHRGFTALPAVGRLGKIYADDAGRARQLAEVSGWLMAVELRSVGVDLSFAPVLDLGRGVSRVIGDRAFHSDPEVVADLARNYMRGMKKAGMAATGKHFPGHGSVAEDSHVAIPVDERRFEDVLAEDLVPFERLIHYGIEGIMAAHVVYRRVDSAPAGFSRFWIQEVLRGRLEFQGAVFSDDLEMEGARPGGDIGDAAAAALRAGCDMVLVCQRPAAMERVLGALAGWENPVSQLRLARMHGRHAPARAALLEDAQWRRAVEMVEGYDEPHTLELM